MHCQNLSSHQKKNVWSQVRFRCSVRWSCFSKRYSEVIRFCDFVVVHFLLDGERKRGKLVNLQEGTTKQFYNALFNTIHNIKLNHLHPNISMHILHTVLCTFPKVLRKRICLTIDSLFQLVIISVILMTFMRVSGVIL